MKDSVIDFDEIKSVDQLKKELISLKRENIAAMKTIEKLLKDLQKKDTEITSLQNLLANSIPVIQPPKDEKKKTEAPPEEEIAKLQLDRLLQAAKTRTLTLEETRMFDLLVKNKHISLDKGKEPQKGSFREVKEIELLQIAEKVISHDESDKP